MKHTTTTATTTGPENGAIGGDAGKRPPLRNRLLVIAAVIVVSTLALAIQAIRHWTRPGEAVIPLLTSAEFDRAQRTWESHGVDSYDTDVEFRGGSNRESIHLEVRKGQVTAVTKNGKPPAQHRTWDEWTVPKQFEMIAADMAKHAHGGFGVREGVKIVLRAEFDSELGYPKRYVLDVVRGRSPLHSNWTVTRFQVVP